VMDALALDLPHVGHRPVFRYIEFAEGRGIGPVAALARDS
jgi:hypothetical protein